MALTLYPDTYTTKLSALYTDGSEDTLDLHTFTPVTEYNVFAIPSGLKHLNLAKTGVSLVSYTIWVENSSHEIAFKKITFYVFPYNPANRCFLFGNLLGGIGTGDHGEPIRFTKGRARNLPKIPTHGLQG